MTSKRRSPEPSSPSSPSSMANKPPIPREALADIFSRLPVKSLIRFQSLSKPFSVLINSPDFISAHLRRSSRHPFLLIRRFHNPTSFNFSISFVDWQKPTILHDTDIPLLGSLISFPKIISSCNGLVCLDISPSHATAFMLWNISTRQCRTVFNPELSNSGGAYWMVSVGFGCNNRMNDYKLVRIVNYCCTEDELPFPKAEVYSWRTGSWRVIEHSVGSCVINEGQRGVLVNGGLHWVAAGGGNLASQKFVVSFDLDTDKLRRIKIPDFRAGVGVKVMGFKGSLALAFYPVYPAYVRSVDKIEVWGLDDYSVDGQSWTKLQVFETTSVLGSPVGVLNDNGLLLKRVEGNYTSLSVFDPGVHGFSRLHVYDADYSCDAFSYVESLVPVYAGGDVVEVLEHLRWW